MTAITVTCRCCGHDFVFPEEAALHDCPACGTPNARPKAAGASLDVLRRANHQRAACDFVNAERSYQHVLLDHPDEHEALWGLVLCKYGVEYVEDPQSSKRLPTVHFLRRRPMQEDADCLRACTLAPAEIRAQYQADAAYIDSIFAAIPAAPDNPPDVFICYKATLPGTGAYTEDFERARMLYYKLSQQGYRVFFAHESLQSTVGANYEAMIFHALQSAKVMLVVCSEGEWLNSPWVHSEWSRYLERVDQDGSCRLIPLLYARMNPSALPAAFAYRRLEGLRMDELDAFETLKHTLSQLTGRKEADPQSPAPDSSKALLRIQIALEDEDWARAADLTSGLIDEYPDYGTAHLYRLLAKLHLHAPGELAECAQPFEEDAAWQRTVRFSTAQEQETLTEYLSASQAYRQQLAAQEAARLEAERREAAEREAARLEAERRKAAEREAARLEAERRKAASTGKAGQLILSRKRQYASSAVPFHFYLDGVKVASLHIGQSVTLPITRDCTLSADGFMIPRKDLVQLRADAVTEVRTCIGIKMLTNFIKCEEVTVKPIFF